MAIRVSLVNGMTNVDEADVSGIFTTLFSSAGIIFETANSLLVQAQGSPDMTIKVNTGHCIIKKTAYTDYSNGLKFWDMYNDGVVNVTIPTANPTNPRIDLICAKFDTGVTPDANATNVGSFVCVSGTPAGSPVAPSVPANHLLIATIAVGAGVTVINSGNITDSRVNPSLNRITLDSAYLNTPTIVNGLIQYPVGYGIYDNGNSGTSKAINWANGDMQKVTMSGNCTFTYSNPRAGQRLTLLLVENGTGGYTITLPTSKYPNGTPPSYVTTANAINAIVVMYDGTNYLTQGATGFA